MLGLGRATTLGLLLVLVLLPATRLAMPDLQSEAL
jgi:hypothetical protein